MECMECKEQIAEILEFWKIHKFSGFSGKSQEFSRVTQSRVATVAAFSFPLFSFLNGCLAITWSHDSHSRFLLCKYIFFQTKGQKEKTVKRAHSKNENESELSVSWGGSFSSNNNLFRNAIPKPFQNIFAIHSIFLKKCCPFKCHWVPKSRSATKTMFS